MDNITEYIDFVKSTCVDPSEVEGAIMENFGELPSSYIPRARPKEEERLGLINDFAAYTAKTPFQVMVIDTRDIWSDSSDEELRRAVRKAEIRTDTEFVKSRVFCAVFHKKHYDLGVVRCEGSVQAVFAAGAEWEAAVARHPCVCQVKVAGPRWSEGTSCVLGEFRRLRFLLHRELRVSEKKKTLPQAHARKERERARKRTRPLPLSFFFFAVCCVCVCVLPCGSG